MRPVSEVEKYWRQLDGFHSLTDLKIHVSSHKEPQITAGLRSVCWKIFLVFKTLDRSSWPTHLKTSRKSYESLRAHYLRAIRNPDEFDASTDPLSDHDESPWTALRADESLRAEIFQDIERCMPDNVYFRQPATQDMMLDILFVWCKMHPSIGYRQGMHEVLGPILWVVERDAIEVIGGKTESEQLLEDLLNHTYIEHDTHALFSTIMQTAKSFYAPVEKGSTPKDTSMLARSARIFDEYLPKADPDLAAHLVKLEIVPQIFLLRWIRLLFGREFSLDAVFDMWDALFAIDSSLEIVDMISIAMLLRIRWELVAANTNEAFGLLLRYPEPTAPAYTFIKDALYLRDHLTPQGGAEIISRYGKQAPVIALQLSKTIREASPSPSFTSHKTQRSLGSPRSFVGQQGAGFEALLQGAAKNVLERGSQWGVGKAIREAVGEVRKNVEALQSAPDSGQSTPRSGGREFRKPGQLSSGPARPGLSRDHSVNILKRIEDLETRNRNLANMLETAVGELWEHHRDRNDQQQGKQDDIAGTKALENLSIAIAKVQFVQVYLEDSTIPLPVDESTQEASTIKAAESLSPENSLSPLPTERATGAPPIQITTDTFSPSTTQSQPAPTQSLAAHPKPSSTLSPRSRPHLTSSNFSWMLGEDSVSSNFATGTAHSAFSSDEKRRMKGKGFLFGDEDEDEVGAKESKRGSVSSKSGSAGRNGKVGKVGKGKQAAETEIEEEVIDLDNMERRGVL